MSIPEPVPVSPRTDSPLPQTEPAQSVLADPVAPEAVTAELAEHAQPATSAVPRTRTRIGMAWVAACSAGGIAILLLVFMVQNSESVPVSFLWMTGSTSLGLMLLIAAVSGAVITLILGTARILQLRRLVRRNSAEQAPAADAVPQRIE